MLPEADAPRCFCRRPAECGHSRPRCHSCRQKDQSRPCDARVGLALRIQLHNAAHLAAQTPRIAGGVDSHGVQIVGFDLGAEAWRTIIDQGNAVDHELRLVLRAARMQHGVAFVEPARLRDHKVLHRAAGQRCRRAAQSAPSRSSSQKTMLKDRSACLRRRL